MFLLNDKSQFLINYLISSAASTKKNSKALEEGQDFQSVQAKELKSANIITLNKASKAEGKHFQESAEKATKDEIGKVSC